jgi:hypothetical protein
MYTPTTVDSLNRTNLAVAQTKLSCIISQLSQIDHLIICDLRISKEIKSGTKTEIQKFIEYINGLESIDYFSFSKEDKVITITFSVTSGSGLPGSNNNTIQLSSFSIKNIYDILNGYICLIEYPSSAYNDLDTIIGSKNQMCVCLEKIEKIRKVLRGDDSPCNYNYVPKNVIDEIELLKLQRNQTSQRRFNNNNNNNDNNNNSNNNDNNNSNQKCDSNKIPNYGLVIGNLNADFSLGWDTSGVVIYGQSQNWILMPDKMYWATTKTGWFRVTCTLQWTAGNQTGTRNTGFCRINNGKLGQNVVMIQQGANTATGQGTTVNWSMDMHFGENDSMKLWQFNDDTGIVKISSVYMSIQYIHD